MVSHSFGGDMDRYYMPQETLDTAKEAIAQAIKSGLPEEARRVDVPCYLFDEMKDWAKAQRLKL